MKRFADIPVHPGKQATPPVFIQGMSRHRHNRQMPVPQLLDKLLPQGYGQHFLPSRPALHVPDEGGGGKAIHDRHLHIHEDHVDLVLCQ